MVAFATQVKRRRGTQEQNDAFTGAEGEIVVDLTNMTLRVHDGRTQGGFVVGGGAGRNIGDIFFTARTDTSLNGAVEANGGQYNTTDFVGAESIGTMLSAGKIPYITLADYQTAVDTNGSCGFFGWDGGTEFRVPKLSDVFIETGIAAQVGQYLSAGIPNITASTRNSAFSGGSGLANTATGAFFATELGNSVYSGAGGGSANSLATLNLDASLASAVYGKSDTVQPPAIRYRPMVQLANGATDEAVVVAGNVLSDIAGIKDGDGFTQPGKNAIVGWGMPDYSAGVTISELPFTAPTDGILYVYMYTTSDYYRLYVNGNRVTYAGGSNNDRNSMTLILNKNDVVTREDGSVSGGEFYPLKGVN